MKSKTENQSSTKDYVTFKFFSEMNAALSGIIRSLDFLHLFYQVGALLNNAIIVRNECTNFANISSLQLRSAFSMVL
jgi:hypothetical protein